MNVCTHTQGHCPVRVRRGTASATKERQKYNDFWIAWKDRDCFVLMAHTHKYTNTKIEVTVTVTNVGGVA